MRPHIFDRLGLQVLGIAALLASASIARAQDPQPAPASTTAANGGAATAVDDLSPRFVERQLGEFYEKTAEDSLKYMLKENEFKVFVNVNLAPNTNLKPLSEKIRNQPLPGTIASHPDANEMFGDFEGLAHSKSVLLLLSPRVPEEKEGLLRETLTGKLRLNLEGDIDHIIVRRSTITIPEDRDHPGRNVTTEVKEARTSVEFWTILGFVLGTLLFAGGAFMFQRIKKKKAGGGDSSILSEEEAAGGGKGGGAGGAVAVKTTLESPELSDYTPTFRLPFKVTSPNQIKDEFELMATMYGGLVAQALQKLVEDKEYLPRIAATMELLGHQKAIELFREAPQKVWQAVGIYMGEHPLSPLDPIDLEETAILYRAILAYIIENKGFDPTPHLTSVFDKYPAQDIAYALIGEQPRTIAVLLSGISQSLAFDIVPKLDPQVKTQVLAIMASIRSIDMKEVRQIEANLARKMSSGGTLNIVPTQNDERVFNSISQMAPHEEEMLFGTMLLADKTIEIRSRKYRLYPIHLRNVRVDILRNELMPYAAEDIAKILRGLEQKVITRVVGVLSERKQAIVMNQLQELQERTMSGEYAQARRYFLDEVFYKYIYNDRDFADSIFEENKKKEVA